MKSLRRGSALTIAAAAAIGAAYVGWPSPAALVGRSAPPATIKAVTLASRSGAGAATTDPLARGVLAETNPCPFCLGGTDLAAFGAEPSDILTQQSFGAGPVGFDDSLNGLGGSTDNATAAPTSQIWTAAMATLGALVLTARRRRGRGVPLWRAPWRSPAVPQSY